MPYQNRYQTFNFPINNEDGTPLDASSIVDAEYVIVDRNGIIKAQKTIADGGLVVSVLDGVNILSCTLTAQESEHLCGSLQQEIKIALVANQYIGVSMSSPSINFIKTRI